MIGVFQATYKGKLSRFSGLTTIKITKLQQSYLVEDLVSGETCMYSNMNSIKQSWDIMEE